jgi:hypothetical protein
VDLEDCTSWYPKGSLQCGIHVNVKHADLSIQRRHGSLGAFYCFGLRSLGNWDEAARRSTFGFFWGGGLLFVFVSIYFLASLGLALHLRTQRTSNLRSGFRFARFTHLYPGG